MRSRDRSQRQNEDHQDCARGKRIGQQRNCDIASGKPLAHDAGAHYCCQEKCGPQKFGYRAGPYIKVHSRPMLSISFFTAGPSRVASGKLRNRVILRSSRKNVSRNAFATCSSVPRTAAGSVMAQCAVIGCPSHTGQVSLAALSQTVITKSSFGESGRENSSHALLRKPLAGKWAASSCRKASGRTTPEGRLPALYAAKVGWAL